MINKLISLTLFLLSLCFGSSFPAFAVEDITIFRGKCHEIRTESDGFTRVYFTNAKSDVDCKRGCYMTIAKDGELFSEFRIDGKETKLSRNIVCGDCYE